MINQVCSYCGEPLEEPQEADYILGLICDRCSNAILKPEASN